MLEHARVVRVGRAGVEVSLRVVPPPPPRAGVDPLLLGQHVAAAVERAEVGVVRAEHLDLVRVRSRGRGRATATVRVVTLTVTLTLTSRCQSMTPSEAAQRLRPAVPQPGAGAMNFHSRRIELT